MVFTWVNRRLGTSRSMPDPTFFCILDFYNNVTIQIFRDTSQDGLENYFGCVKTCNQTKKATPRGFRTGYATMTINNITGSNSLRSNCERDSSTSILSNIHEFILDHDKKGFVDMDTDDCIVFDPMYESGPDEVENGVNDFFVYNPDSDEEMDLANCKVVSKSNDVNELIIFDPQIEDVELDSFGDTCISQSSRVICQKLARLIKFNQCIECKTNLKTDENVLLQNCSKVLCSLNEIIPHICTENNLKKKLIGKISSIDTLGCQNHNLEINLKIKELCVDHAINAFNHNINQFLSGKVDALPANCNHIQKLAFAAYDQKRKKKKIGKYSDIFNS